MDKNKQQTVGPGLYLVSTPIGNMEDITLRALNILKKSDIILCEDTRRSGKLLSYFQIKSKLLPYHKFNEKKVGSKVIDSIKKDKIVSLISDAGTPAVSDPGMILVNKCSDQYLFYGFLTKEKNKLESVLKNLSNLDYSIIFFIPASKINFYISKLKKYFFGRKIVIAKEMTKIHEEFIRGNIESMENLTEPLKGELTVVLSEIIKKNNIKKEIHESVKIEIKKMLKKYTHKDVVEFVSKKENLPKKMIYNYCLKLKK